MLIQQENNNRHIAIVFHSNYGHTRRVAQAIQSGADVAVKTRLIDVATISEIDWQYLDDADMIVFWNSGIFRWCNSRLQGFHG